MEYQLQKYRKHAAHEIGPRTLLKGNQQGVHLHVHLCISVCWGSVGGDSRLQTGDTAEERGERVRSQV